MAEVHFFIFFLKYLALILIYFIIGHGILRLFRIKVPISSFVQYFAWSAGLGFIFSSVIIALIFSYGKTIALAAILPLAWFIYSLKKDENISNQQNLKLDFDLKEIILALLLLVILYITIYYKEYKNFKWIIPGLLIGILYLFKNLWTFGYPIFPLTILDFNLPWKPHPYLMEFSARTAIEKTYDNQFTYEQIKEFKPWDYIYNWLFLKGIKSYIHIIFIASLVGFGIYTLLSKKKLIGVIFLSILIKSILVLLFSAQYRFFIDVFFVIAFIIFIDVLRKKTIYLLFLIGSIFVATPLSFPKLLQQTISSFKLGYFMAGFTPSQIIKPAFYGYKEYDTYQIGNLEFNIVKDYPFSFETPLPAITPEFIEHYSKAQIFPQKISDNVKDGFIWKKTTKEEQEKLDKILKNWKHSYDNRKK